MMRENFEIAIVNLNEYEYEIWFNLQLSYWVVLLFYILLFHASELCFLKHMRLPFFLTHWDAICSITFSKASTSRITVFRFYTDQSRVLSTCICYWGFFLLLPNIYYVLRAFVSRFDMYFPFLHHLFPIYSIFHE